MPVYLGTTNISNIRVGDVAASKVYVGATEVWSGVAYPTIAGTNTGFGTSLTGSPALTPPAGTAVGDLLVGFCSHDAASLITAANWVLIGRCVPTAVVHSFGAFARIADGTANDNFPPTTVAAQDYCSSVLRITGHGVTNPVTQIKVSGLPATVVGTADSPNLDTGVSAGWLWLAVMGLDGTTASVITAPPAGYTDAHPVLTSAAATSTLLAVASKKAAARSENPGPWTNTSRVWIAATLAIPPPATTLPTFYIAGASVLQTSGSGDRIIQPDLGTQIGDVILVINNLGGAITTTPPAGFTEIKPNTATGTMTSSCYAKVRAAADSSYAFTMSGSINSTHVCLNIRGALNIATIQIGADGTRAASGGDLVTTAPSVTATVANSMALCIATERSSAAESGITSVTNGFTEYMFVPHGAGGTETIWIGTRAPIGAAVPVGATSITYPNTQALNGYAFQLSIRP